MSNCPICGKHISNHDLRCPAREEPVSDDLVGRILRRFGFSTRNDPKDEVKKRIARGEAVSMLEALDALNDGSLEVLDVSVPNDEDGSIAEELKVWIKGKIKEMDDANDHQ